MARCTCGGGGCNCVVQAGDNTTVTGSGSTANPYIVNAITNCPEVRACLSDGNGITYTPGTGLIETCLSADAGNNIVYGTDGCLFVPTGAATVTAGCGLTGNGAAATPLTVATGAWPYPCSLDTFGGVVACDSNGVLRSEPRGMVSFHSFNEQRNYADLLVPAGFDQPGDSFQTDVTNPDPCRSALILVEREADVDFVLPAGAGAAYGHATDEMFYTRNTGTTTINDAHVQTTKVFALGALLGPGATTTITFDVTLGRGSAGATWNRIQVFIRALLISL